MAADKDEPWAYLAQGMVAFAGRDDALTMAALTRAVALNPNSAFAHGQFSIAHAIGGRADEAVACIDHAVRLSPREAVPRRLRPLLRFRALPGRPLRAGAKVRARGPPLAARARHPAADGRGLRGHLADAEAAAGLLQELRALVPGVSRASVEATSGFVRAEDRARLVEGLARAGLD